MVGARARAPGDERPGDAGGALGAAQIVWHMVEEKPRTADGKKDSMRGSYLGPNFDDDEIEAYLNANGYAEWTRVVRPILERDLGSGP